MNVTQLVPEIAQVSVDSLIADLTVPEARLAPFNEDIIDLFNTLALKLLRDPEARRYPEIQALGFWMRKAELLRLKEQFDSLASNSTLLAPRGLVFHVPPSNVDTIFIYSWLMSVLVGNTNIIRLSERAADAAQVLCRVLRELFADSGHALSRNTAIVQYGRQQEITAQISAACDVRVLWGGDASVNALRSTSIAPHAKELTFPDRTSFSVFRADAVMALDERKRIELASEFYNDTFWFDQMACSSPRMIVWVGSEQTCRQASAALYSLLEKHVQSKQYQLAGGSKLNKLTFAYRAILDRPVTSFQSWGSEVAVLHLETLQRVDKEHCGGGLLFHAWTQTLEEIMPIVSRRDQTVTHFGFGHDELYGFAQHLKGRGVDRLVPVGQALLFNRFWDGYDLLREFTRVVYVQA